MFQNKSKWWNRLKYIYKTDKFSSIINCYFIFKKIFLIILIILYIWCKITSCLNSFLNYGCTINNIENNWNNSIFSYLLIITNSLPK